MLCGQSTFTPLRERAEERQRRAAGTATRKVEEEKGNDEGKRKAG